MDIKNPFLPPLFFNGVPSGTAIVGQTAYDFSGASYISYVYRAGAWHLAGDGAGGITPGNPTATAGPTAVNGAATTYMRSDAAPAVQLGTASQKGIVQVDNATITATAGIISAVQQTLPSAANPSATAGPTAVNGAAATFMRSDAAPAVQKASAAQFGIVEVDNTTITAAAGVISATAQNISTQQKFTASGAGTWTRPTPAPRQIKVRMYGGGGGGGGSGTSPGASVNGSDTIFNAVHAGGGTGGANGSIAAGGTSGTGAANFRLSGTPGPAAIVVYGTSTSLVGIGGNGAGQGGGTGGVGAANGVAGAANMGGGGGAGGIGNTVIATFVAFSLGNGGAEGEYVELIINAPAASIALTVGAGGAGGTAGTSGQAGAAGGSGIVIVDELY